MNTWIKDFLTGKAIQVKIGKSYVRSFVVENGTPLGSVISPLLFSVMIDDVFSDMEKGLGLSLFADNGAIWKRGRKISFVVKKIQEAIGKVEEWSLKWGFRFSVSKTKAMLFTRKRINDIQLRMYSQDIERVKHFKFLGLWFDERLTWSTHIQRIIDTCKKSINVMRCLAGHLITLGNGLQSIKDHLHGTDQIAVGLWVCSVWISIQHFIKKIGPYSESITMKYAQGP